MARKRLLILGGSTEAFALAERLADWPEFSVITSFAGRTRKLRPVAGAHRVGGFGGVSGLVAYLKDQNIDVLIDATHPFAHKMSANALAAAKAAAIPHLMILRPPWQAEPGDDWREVASMAEAAAAIPQGADPTFLAVGRTELPAFAGRRDLSFLARVIDPPETDPGIARLKLVFARGPFDLAQELALFREHGVACVVTKNSGGDAARAKLLAARQLGLPVILVKRPPMPPAETVPDVASALAWLKTQIGGEVGSHV